MSIVTRTGDAGDTSLLFNRRVAKDHPRVEAYGTVDELNAALGLIRASLPGPDDRALLLAIQQHLVGLMGELAVLPEDEPRYRDKYPDATADKLLEKLDAACASLEKELPGPFSWAMPGESPISAHIDFARTIARRAERRIVSMNHAGHPIPMHTLPALNRLSDYLWLLGRKYEKLPQAS
ncbi:MAG: cob(I)yrinic acid a,c-diamide adenosyltransferase [Bdellovibrionaceae bacterium]|nr:cob(I)yrinic acid a,c-diamide adenosyltransferase [Pseudobdellovibrionaceae bacterium]